jgi:hypothetical protein
MKIIQFLKHIRLWWLTSPFNSPDMHLWIGKLGDAEYTCPVCGATKIDKDEDDLERDEQIKDAFLTVDWEKLEKL